ncbi:MAG: MerR family transcriptional regulator [Vicinamibacterales bacterium]
MQLKGSYSAREVSAFTGLSARQLQWWDHHGVFPPAVAPKRTAAGGFTERRYSPLDTLDLLVLAELRRRKYSVDDIRRIIQVLRTRFGARPHETLEHSGRMTLLTDGREIFVRVGGRYFNLLRDPEQPLLVGEERLKGIKVRKRSSRLGKRLPRLPPAVE